MNALERSNQQYFGTVAIDFWKDEHGEVWMTAEQIGRALDFSNPGQSVLNIFNRYRYRLEDKSVQTKLMSTDGKTYETRLFNRLGLYEILRHSNQPKADAFFDWVWGVLETIRATGSYSMKSQPDLPADYLSALKALVEAEEVKQAQAEQLALQAPKVELYDVALSAENAQSVSVVAKALNIGPLKLFAWLRDQKILMSGGSRHNLPYERYITAGYFEVREVPIMRSKGPELKPQTLVTPKGMAYIHERWQAAHGALQEVR